MEFPSHILSLAEKAGGVPLAFSEKPDCITIVFVDGRKLIFDRVQTIDIDTSIPLPPPPLPPDIHPEDGYHAQSTPIVQAVPKKTASKSTRKEKKQNE